MKSTEAVSLGVLSYGNLFFFPNQGNPTAKGGGLFSATKQ